MRWAFSIRFSTHLIYLSSSPSLPLHPFEFYTYLSLSLYNSVSSSTNFNSFIINGVIEAYQKSTTDILCTHDGDNIYFSWAQCKHK